MSFSIARPVLACALLAGCAGSQARFVADPAPAPVGRVDATVYVVGDAGDASEGRDRVFAHLRADIERVTTIDEDAPVAVLFLGDNIYDVGAREEHRDVDLAQLRAQIGALGNRPTVRGIFLPGNHDWGKGAADSVGRAAVLRQADWLEELAPDRVTMLPAGACPGPAGIDLAGRLRLVFVDSEWLLRRPADECGDVQAFLERLRDELSAADDRHVVLVAHHPMASGGGHAGNVGLLEYVPVLFYLATKSGISVQDLASPRYAEMLDQLRGAIAASGTRPLAVVSGHDHSLQVVGLSDPTEPRFQLVSGSASKRAATDRVEGTRYASGDHGYMRLDATGDAVYLTVFATGPDEDGPVRAVFRCSLVEGGRPAPCRAAERAR